MRLRIDSTPAELADKAPDLVRAVAAAIRPVNYDLADDLENSLEMSKALGVGKAPKLRYPVMLEIKRRASEAYQESIESMLDGIGRVLDASIAQKSLRGQSDALEKGGPFIGPRGGKWADPKHTIPWQAGKASPATASSAPGSSVTVQMHGEPTEFHVVSVTEEEVRISRFADGEFGPRMPREALKHFVNDLNGKVDLPPSEDKRIQAVIDGEAKWLGKGDDGIAFRVGDSVVKVSTTVPYQPENPGHRTPEGAADMLRRQVEVGNYLADKGVPGIQRSQFVRHGDKGFQIKKWVEIPEKLTEDQLEAAQRAVLAVHDQGYTINDTIQVGIEAGEVVLFDIGKAAVVPEDSPKTGIWSRYASDIDALRLLYKDSGVKFRHLGESEVQIKLTEFIGEIDKRITKSPGFVSRHLSTLVERRLQELDPEKDASAIAELRDQVDIYAEELAEAGKPLAPDVIEGLGLNKSLENSDLNQLLEDLEKAAGHKYLRRWKGKDGRWRYEYQKLGRQVLRRYAVGDKIALSQAGKSGHFEVIEVKEDKEGTRLVKVRHDETSKELWVKEKTLARVFITEHDIRHEVQAATIQINAKLFGYDYSEGPGSSAPRVTGYWAKRLRERRKELGVIFGDVEEYEGLVDYAAWSEELDWHLREAHAAIDAAKPVIQDIASARSEIREEAIEGLLEPLLAFQRRYRYAVSEMQTALDRMIQKAGRDTASPAVRYLVEQATAALAKAELKDQDAYKIRYSLPAAVRGTQGGKTPEQALKVTKTAFTKQTRVLETAMTFALQAKQEIEFEQRRKKDPITETVTKKGVTYAIHAAKAELTKVAEMDVGKYLGTLTRAEDLVRKAGFAEALEDVVTHVAIGPERDRPAMITPGFGSVSLGGYYRWKEGVTPTPDSPTKGEVYLYTTGFRSEVPDEVYVHELGHRYFYRSLTESQRAKWNAEVEDRSFTIQQEDVGTLSDAVRNLRPVEGSIGKCYWADVEKALLEAAPGRVGKTAAAYLARTLVLAGDPLLADRLALKDLLEGMKDHKAVDPFVSWYGGSNASEYFAEAFTAYVMQGPRDLPEWTRYIFKDITQKSLERPDSLEADHTQAKAQAAEVGHKRAKTRLRQLGYTEDDFEAGGVLYGTSTNQLVEMIQNATQ